MRIIGYIGAFLLGICGLPEAIKTVQTEHCSIGWGMLSTWFIGEILTTTYVVVAMFGDKKIIPLILNYAFNLILISIMLYYKVMYA